jgi:DNA-binding XRE family transcriptional regulator
MLPFCDRLVSVPRKDVAPVWTRSFPIAKVPTTLGEHLKKKRFGAGIRQSEAARILGVSARTLSLWECDRLFPTVPNHARIIAYMGYDPFEKLMK